MTRYEQGFIKRANELGYDGLELLKTAAKANFKNLSPKELKRIASTAVLKNILDKKPRQSRFIASRLRSNGPGGKRMRVLLRENNPTVKSVAKRLRAFETNSFANTGDPRKPVTMLDYANEWGGPAGAKNMIVAMLEKLNP